MAILLALPGLPSALWAWDAQALLDVVPTAALVPSTMAPPPLMQAETTAVSLQAAVSHSQALAEGLSVSGTIWGMADTLPSGTPFAVPSGKVDIQSRILEMKLIWEVLPGTLIWDVGKKVIHPSSGFFRTPLNVISHGRLGNTSNLTGSAVGTWEEGWVGTDVTLLVGSLSISNFFSPRLAWSSQADTALQYFTLPQDDWQDLARVDIRLGEADVRLLGLLSTGGPGSPDPDLHAQVGAGLDTNLGDSITIRAEVAAADSRERLAVADELALTSALQTVKWAPRALAGFTWSNGHQLSVMAEYYYNGGGFAGDEYSRLIRYSVNNRSAPVPGADLLDQFGAFSAGQNYGFVRVSGKIDESLSAAAWTQVNLQDLSGLSGIVLTITHDRWGLNGSVVDAWGRSDTEAGLSPLLWKVDVQFSLSL